MSLLLSSKVGSWYDCINPLGLPAHSHFFETGDTISIYYANKICPMCWDRIQPHKNTIGQDSPGWVEKKYQSRNDRSDIMPSSDYN